ncbi:glycosyltransferase family 2 protein [Jannaschia pohangensis]|uniref:Glycosyl transferase family 2 n=1 Tax=Jannaschia pohangensis TaxID=390807 RepID=A0A1I3RFS0_9RHOB|nr:glycosyltransferase family 2 protein [Jannaschia pohangensis]SFJ44026.1 Glycosyl transferase family 2 [Jannaschia pohangensis]
MTEPHSPPPRIAVVLCTMNGAEYLRAQLDSIAAQTMPPALIVVSDDGSTDGTEAIVDAFAADWTGTIIRRAGPRRGYAANFLGAIGAVPETDYLALSDQDDVWYPDKLARAVAALEPLPGPALYGAATRVCDRDLTRRSLSRITRVPLTFRHALTQNFAGGNTMVLNASALRIVQAAARLDLAVPVHDWFLYQLVTGAGGTALFDPVPCLDYRQHASNQIGDAAGLGALAHRMRRMVRGDYRVWMDANLAALTAAADLLSPDARALLARVRHARDAVLSERLSLMRDAGLYRQGALGQLGLAGALLLRRF